MKVKCNKCSYIGDESEFPKGRDFFQFTFISGCPKCDNSQSPSSASLRMMPSDEKRPFENIRSEPKDETPLRKVLHKADIDNFMSKVIDLTEKEKEETILFLAESLINDNYKFLKLISPKVQEVVLPFLTDIAVRSLRETVGSLRTLKEGGGEK